MRNKCLRHLAAVGVLCLNSVAWSQGSEEEHSLKGEVYADQALLWRSGVTLRNLRTRQTIGSASIDGDGSFEVRYVPRGDYILTVLDANSQPLFEQQITVQDPRRPVEVRVPYYPVERPPSGSISAEQLLHPQAKKAVEAFVAARKLADAGAYDKAAAQLQRAVQISPGYGDAWVNLGAQHLRLGQYQQALDALSRAGEINGPSPIILGNIACAQHGLHHEADAAQAARRALQFDATYAPGHLILGIILASARRTLPEGVAHLEIAARTIPSARATLEQARRDLSATESH